MNRNRDFDQTMRHWLDDGADQAPERFIWAALEDTERIAQRGAWQASLEGLFMKLKSAAPYLGVAAVIVLAIAVYQVFAGPNIGNSIVLTEVNAPDGLTVDSTDYGAAALVIPLHAGGPLIDQTAFVDALMTNLNSTETGGYVSWSALFETVADAEVGFDYIVNEHGSAAEWGMETSSVDPGLGDESVSFTGAAYDIFETNIVHVWRVGNLVLAAVAVGDLAVGEANADRLLELARLMDDRAH
jgi:hypothetical protein